MLPFLTVEQVLIFWDKESGVEDFIRKTRFDRTGKPFGFVIPTPSTPEVFAAKAPFVSESRYVATSVPQAPRTSRPRLRRTVTRHPSSCTRATKACTFSSDGAR